MVENNRTVGRENELLSDDELDSVVGGFGLGFLVMGAEFIYETIKKNSAAKEPNLFRDHKSGGSGNVKRLILIEHASRRKFGRRHSFPFCMKF